MKYKEQSKCLPKIWKIGPSLPNRKGQKYLLRFLFITKLLQLFFSNWSHSRTKLFWMKCFWSKKSLELFSVFVRKIVFLKKRHFGFLQFAKEKGKSEKSGQLVTFDEGLSFEWPICMLIASMFVHLFMSSKSKFLPFFMPSVL